jgi:hypothetical protein
MTDPSPTPAKGVQEAQDPPSGAPKSADAPWGLRRDGKPKRKPGVAKGRRPGGRKKGTKNKARVARERKAAQEIAELELIETARKAMLAAEVEAATGKPPITGKEALIQLVSVYMGLTAFYQPTAPLRYDPALKRMVSANPNYDEAMFRHYSAMAKEAATALTPFQHPRYSAMMVGASVVTKVKVEGGMKDDFVPPVPDGVVLDLKPGTIITAEDDEIKLPIPVQKVG